MQSRKLAVVIVAVLSSILFGAGVSAAGQLYGVGRAPSGNESSLYMIDPTDGSSTLLGPTGFDLVSALAFLRDGRLVGTVNSLVTDPLIPGQQIGITELIEIDPTSGASASIGLIGDSVTSCGRITDLAYDDVTDTLHGFSSYCFDDETRLVIIDQQTGAGVAVGTTNVDLYWFPNGLAVEAGTGTVYATATVGIPGILTSELLFTIDSVSGEAIELGGLAGAGVIWSLDFHPTSGQLYGASCCSNLLTIDVSEVTLSSGTPVEGPFWLDAIAFGPSQPPSVEVPTLGDWELIGWTGLLAMFAVGVLRRKLA